MKDYESDIEKWESGELGASAEHVRVSSPAKAEAVDAALGLQLVSIRLPRKLIADLKAIAEYHGIAYQPMVRDLLTRFSQAETKMILTKRLDEITKDLEESAEQGTEPVNQFMNLKQA